MSQISMHSYSTANTLGRNGHASNLALIVNNSAINKMAYIRMWLQINNGVATMCIQWIFLFSRTKRKITGLFVHMMESAATA